jgi:hypothetical protein
MSTVSGRKNCGGVSLVLVNRAIDLVDTSVNRPIVSPSVLVQSRTSLYNFASMSLHVVEIIHSEKLEFALSLTVGKRGLVGARVNIRSKSFRLGLSVDERRGYEK